MLINIQLLNSTASSQRTRSRKKQYICALKSYRRRESLEAQRLGSSVSAAPEPPCERPSRPRSLGCLRLGSCPASPGGGAGLTSRHSLSPDPSPAFRVRAKRRRGPVIHLSDSICVRFACFKQTARLLSSKSARLS